VNGLPGRPRALVRRPSPGLAAGELTHLTRVPLDVELAFAQHAAYVALLRAHGFEIIEAPAAPEQPDGLFVEDVLVMVAGHGILTRPGASSRRGELTSIEPLLRALGVPFERITAPATLDGGDVLVTSRHVLVGESTRSNREAQAQLSASAACLGREVLGVAVTGVLHLKSALTLLPDAALIALPACVDTGYLRSLGYRVHHALEASGADVLCLDQTVLLPADAPNTAAWLREQGYRVLSIDISELQKLEAGVTCMSVLL
jgi:dimethylargininase